MWSMHLLPWKSDPFALQAAAGGLQYVLCYMSDNYTAVFTEYLQSIYMTASWMEGIVGVYKFPSVWWLDYSIYLCAQPACRSAEVMPLKRKIQKGLRTLTSGVAGHWSWVQWMLHCKSPLSCWFKFTGHSSYEVSLPVAVLLSFGQQVEL